MGTAAFTKEASELPNFLHFVVRRVRKGRRGVFGPSRKIPLTDAEADTERAPQTP